MATGGPSRPAKKSRKEEGAEPVPSAGASSAPVGATEPVRDSDREPPIGKGVPDSAGTEEGEITATAGAAVVVVDLEGDGAGAGIAPEVVQGETAAKAPTPARLKSEKPSPPARAKRTPPPAETEMPEKRPGGGEKKKRSEQAPRRPPPIPARPRVEGPQDKVGRPGPLLSTMGDAKEASCLLAQISTPETLEEVRGLSPAGVLDLAMVSVVQTAHGILGLREALARNAEALGKAINRANNYKKESEALAQSLARLHKENKAREEDQRSRLQEAERRVQEAAAQVSLLESKLDSAACRFKTLHARGEEQDRQLHLAREEATSARDEVRAGAKKVAAAERAAAEATTLANEAKARAEEAEAEAREAKARVQAAEAGKEKAVEEYKSSPEFKAEIIEGSLDAYVKGFDLCKEKMAKVFKIDGAELEKIQPVELEEEQGGDEEGVATGES